MIAPCDFCGRTDCAEGIRMRHWALRDLDDHTRGEGLADELLEVTE